MPRRAIQGKQYSSAKILLLAALLFTMLSGPASQIAIAQKAEAVDSLKQQTGRIDLTQAIQIAMANNTDIQRALLSVKDADQEVRTAWSEVYPQVTASADYIRNLEVPVNFIPEVVFNPDGDPNNLIPVAFGTDNDWAGGVTVSQTLFDGQAFVGINSSKLFKTAQAETLRTTAQQIVTQTRLAYYQVLIAQEQVKLQQDQINRIQENLSDARAQLEQGFVDDYAVLQLEVQLSNLQPQLTQAAYDVDEAKRNLLDAMGLPVKLRLEPKGSLNAFDIRSQTTNEPANSALKQVDTMTPLNIRADSLMIDEAMKYRGDLRVLDVQKQLQEKQIKANRSEYLPTLSASYSLRYNASQSGQPVFFGTGESRARSQTVMLSLSVPIFEGFRRDATVEQAKIQLRDLELLEYQLKQDAQQEITAAEEDIKEVYETTTARRKALEQATRGYDRALLRFRNGLGSQQEVTDAQLQLREAELNYAQNVFAYLSAKARYDQAIGLVPFVDQNPEAVKKDIQN